MNIDFEIVEVLFFFDYSKVLIEIYEIYHGFGNKLEKILIDKFIFSLFLLCEMAPETYNSIFIKFFSSDR
jgi:hypothetical protein